MDYTFTDCNELQQNKYNYNALNYLEKDIRNLNLFNTNHICIYKINNENKYPFLQFLFYKNVLNDSYSFLNYIDFDLDFNENFDEQFNFIEKLKKYICSLMNQKNKYVELIKNDIDLNDYLKLEDIKFNGFLDEYNNNYLFFNIQKIDEFIYNHTLNLGLIDEIVNYNTLDGKIISLNVITFFQRNNDFMYLTNENNENYEIPVSGYLCKPKKWLEFTNMFGEIRNKDGILGNYYYFTNYEHAKREYNEHVKNKEYGYGIIKFALFTGIMKTFLSKTFMNNNYLNEMEQEEKDSWVEVYDSCYYLENYETPFWVIKDYTQQVSLSICD
jgi:hypothetical protein